MDMNLSVAEGHICNMGRMIEEMESKLRNSLDQVYFGKTREMVCTLRPPAEVVMRLPDCWCWILWHKSVDSQIHCISQTYLAVCFSQQILCSYMFLFWVLILDIKKCSILKPLVDLRSLVLCGWDIDAHWIGNSFGLYSSDEMETDIIKVKKKRWEEKILQLIYYISNGFQVPGMTIILPKAEVCQKWKFISSKCDNREKWLDHLQKGMTSSLSKRRGD